MVSGPFHLLTLDRTISNVRDVWSVLLLSGLIEIPIFNANSVDPDQMPHTAASDQGLHCLPMSLLWDTKHIWIKVFEYLE